MKFAVGTTKLIFIKKIIIHDPLLMHPIDFTEKVSKFSFGDFNDMLSYHGLQVQEAFGDYQLGNYDTRKKPRLILVARKNSKMQNSSSK